MTDTIEDMTEQLQSLASSSGFTGILVGGLGALAEDDELKNSGPRGAWMTEVASRMQRELADTLEAHMKDFDRIWVARERLQNGQSVLEDQVGDGVEISFD